MHLRNFVTSVIWFSKTDGNGGPGITRTVTFARLVGMYVRAYKFINSAHRGHNSFLECALLGSMHMVLRNWNGFFPVVRIYLVTLISYVASTLTILQQK